MLIFIHFFLLIFHVFSSMMLFNSFWFKTAWNCNWFYGVFFSCYSLFYLYFFHAVHFLNYYFIHRLVFSICFHFVRFLFCELQIKPKPISFLFSLFPILIYSHRLFLAQVIEIIFNLPYFHLLFVSHWVFLKIFIFFDLDNLDLIIHTFLLLFQMLVF